MFFNQKFIVRKHERGLLFKDGDFQSFLAPATYRFFGLQNRYAVEQFDLANPAFTHRLVDYLLEAERDTVDRLFEVVETNANQVAVVYHNKRLTAVLGPNERALYWKGVVGTVVERYNLDDVLAIPEYRSIARDSLLRQTSNIAYVVAGIVTENVTGAFEIVQIYRD